MNRTRLIELLLADVDAGTEVDQANAIATQIWWSYSSMNTIVQKGNLNLLDFTELDRIVGNLEIATAELRMKLRLMAIRARYAERKKGKGKQKRI